MLRAVLKNRLDAEESKLGESMDYLRHIVDVSPAAFLRFASIMPFANSRSALPADAWFVAQTVAVRHEDCAPCLQITLNLAGGEAVSADILQAVLDGRPEALPGDLADVYRFSVSVVESTGDDGLRQRMRERYGERGLVELAYAIAAGKIPPTLKRVLGYAESCSVRPVSPKSPAL